MKRSVGPTKRMRGCSGERKHKEKSKISKQEFLGQIKAVLLTARTFKYPCIARVRAFS